MVRTLAALMLLWLAPPATAGIWAPVESETTGPIRAIDYQSPTRFWYATGNGEVGRISNGAFVNEVVDPAVVFNDIAFKPSGNSGVVVGIDGTVRYSTDGGDTWLPSTYATFDSDCNQYHAGGISPTSPLTGALRAVAWGDGDTVYAVGDKATVLKSSDGGASFAEKNKYEEPAMGGEYVRCRLDLTGAVGDLVPIAPGVLYFMGGDGKLWFSADDLASTADERSAIGYGNKERYSLVVDPANSNRLWSLSSDVTDGVYASTDGGVSYVASVPGHIVNANGQNFTSPQSMAGAGQLTLVAVGKTGQILNSVDGQNWYLNPADAPFAGTDWFATDGFDANNFAVGGTGGALLSTGQATTLPTTPPGGGGAPTLTGPGSATLASRTATVRRKRFKLTIACAAGAPACEGDLRVDTAKKVRLKPRGTKKKVRLGKASFSVAAGASAKVTVKLTKAGQRLLRSRRSLKSRVTLTTRGANAATATGTAKLKLKKPATKKRRR